MDHSQHARLTEDEFTDAVLTGATVYGPEDETVGVVSHVHGNGSGAEVIIDVGGFLGIGAKPIAVPAANLDFMRDEMLRRASFGRNVHELWHKKISVRFVSAGGFLTGALRGGALL